MSSKKFPQLAPTIFVAALAASVASSTPADRKTEGQWDRKTGGQEGHADGCHACPS